MKPPFFDIQMFIADSIPSSARIRREHLDCDCRATHIENLAEARISPNLIQNLPARAARENFREICLEQGVETV